MAEAKTTELIDASSPTEIISVEETALERALEGKGVLAVFRSVLETARWFLLKHFRHQRQEEEAYLTLTSQIATHKVAKPVLVFDDGGQTEEFNFHRWADGMPLLPDGWLGSVCPRCHKEIDKNRDMELRDELLFVNCWRCGLAQAYRTPDFVVRFQALVVANDTRKTRDERMERIAMAERLVRRGLLKHGRLPGHYELPFDPGKMET